MTLLNVYESVGIGCTLLIKPVLTGVRVKRHNGAPPRRGARVGHVGYAICTLCSKIIPSNYTPHAHSARIAYRFELARLRNANNISVWPSCLSSGTHLISCLVLLDACIFRFLPTPTRRYRYRVILYGTVPHAERYTHL